MDITDIKNLVHKTANEKGFWDDFNNALKKTNSEPIKQAFLSQKLMLIVSELGESLEALRSNNFSKREEYQKHIKRPHLMESEKKEIFEMVIKNTFEDELADAIIRILDLCAQMNIDINWHIEKKMEYNNLRHFKHGKNF